MATPYPNVPSTPCSLPPIPCVDLPERGRPAEKAGYRELVAPFGRGAYVIRYRIDYGRDTVVIARIWHGREQR
jgi:plasmid stabilization system protein ParE